jgi:hypothetical protein
MNLCNSIVTYIDNGTILFIKRKEKRFIISIGFQLLRFHHY